MSVATTVTILSRLRGTLKAIAKLEDSENDHRQGIKGKGRGHNANDLTQF